MTRFNTLPDNLKDKVKNKENIENFGTENKLVILGDLPGMNEIIDQNKIHWANYAKIKKNYDDIVCFYAQQQGIKFFEKVKLNITYYMSNKKMDPDNICAAKKFILDGLVDAGVLKDDSWDIVKGFKENWEVDKDNPRIEVELEEVE